MGTIAYALFFGANVAVLKLVNSVVTEPYMVRVWLYWFVRE